MLQPCCDTFDVWTDIVTPLIITPILLGVKILYDKYMNIKEQTKLLKNQSKLDKIKNKLENFYWPLYIRLLKDYDLWSNFAIFNTNFYNYLESDDESDLSDSENYDINICSFKKTIVDKNGISILYACKCPVHRNSNFNEIGRAHV